MGIFLKYVFYLILIMTIYLVGKGIFQGQITETTTVGQVISDVEEGIGSLTEKAVAPVEESMENYENAAKEKVNLSE